MKTPNWSAIRRFYSLNQQSILGAGPTDWGVDPYSWDFELGIEMTPIEDAIWCELRTVGCVMYPQYPVGKRFVDFGNPCARVAIECDGAAFHADASSDKAREEEITALGWTVYRISGSDCMRITRVRECMETGRIAIIQSPGHQLARRIAERHGIGYAPSQSSKISIMQKLLSKCGKNFVTTDREVL